MPGLVQNGVISPPLQPRSAGAMADLESAGAKFELTLALIKPNAFEKVNEIEDRILAEGFSIIQRKETTLSEEEAKTFYSDHEGKDFFEDLVEFMTSGSIAALALVRENAIRHWRYLLGPTNVEKAREEEPDSIRALYGETAGRNGAHGSDTAENANRELQFFFPDLTLEEFLLAGGTDADFVTESINPTLLTGLRAVYEEQPENPVEWLSDWLRRNNPIDDDPGDSGEADDEEVS